MPHGSAADPNAATRRLLINGRNEIPINIGGKSVYTRYPVIFGNISVVFLPASDGAEAERVAIRLAPCEFKRFEVRCPGGL